MGAAESTEPAYNESKVESNTTPIKNKRVLKLQDPRSPTEEINRTPIVTEVHFEDPRSPTVDICRTPVADTSDPRSPTEGIPRTPSNPFTFPDPRSPSVGLTRTPLLKTNEGFETLPSVPESSRVTESDKVAAKPNSNENIEKIVSKSEPKHSGDNVVAEGADKSRTTDVDVKDDDRINERKTDLPEFELKMAGLNVDESNANEVLDESQSATLVVFDAESRRKQRNSAAKKSLKEKFQNSVSVPNRSPLSSRNILQNSPSSGHQHHNMGKHYTNTRTRPTNLVGRYEPVSDKENM